MGNKIISILNAFMTQPWLCLYVYDSLLMGDRTCVCNVCVCVCNECVWVIEFLFKATEMALKAKLSANA